MKFCIYLALCIALIFYSLTSSNEFNLETIGGGTYEFYSTDIIDNPIFTRVTDLGFGFIYECDATYANSARGLFSHIDGECIRFENDIDIKTLLAKIGARIINTQKIDGRDILYAYTAKNENYITENGKRINLQIVKNDGKTIIGTPVILGSY